uniref:Doublecortin domain-containing protein n=1 Tax=Sander lucioperca TaxID=283035 RepID=A0A8C9XZB3_SANLU
CLLFDLLSNHPPATAERLPIEMSSHKRNFQCFNAVGGEGFHKSSLPFKYHTSLLPRIHHHGMVAHQEPLEECYLCSEYRHAQALEALETQVTPLYHTHTPYHHHHPHEYVLRGPTRPEEHPVAHSGHIHHHRFNNKVVLVKNSDPLFKKTIILHPRSLRSLGLFLEEVSELMQYHIRKLYTVEGHKIDNVQSLMQCPSVLVCVGREPSHPSIVENFQKTSDDKLPKLSGRSRSSGLPTKKSVIHPQLESDNRSTRQSASSDKSLPDGTNSPDNVDSCLHTGDGMRDDDIEKRVRVNKDGSLSMEMKVRFRLQNDETIHWSTEVKKTTGSNSKFLEGHNDPDFAQVSDRSYSESENISAGEQRSGLHSTESADISDAGNAEEESEGRPQSTMSVKSAKSVKSNISAISSESKSSEAPNKESDDNYGDGIDVEQTGDDEAEARASSAMSEKSSAISSKSKASKDRSEENNDEEEIAERALSAMSAKSEKSNASAVSTKSKGICDEGDAEEETSERSPSCMSEKSSKSNISARSRKSKCCDGSDRETITEYEEERGPSALSVKSSNESDLSQTLSSSDIVKEIEISSVGESKSSVSKRITNGPLKTRSVKDNKSDKSSKCRYKNTNADDFKLVPSSLPNASPTEVVNEWLNSIPADGDMYGMEEFNENCDGQKQVHTTEEMTRIEDTGNDDSAVENTKDTNEGVMVNSFPNDDIQTSTEAPNADNSPTCTQRDDAAKIFNSSVQVMKVLLNPKLDRSNSLPEISPVYGRKLSTSARGLLDCLVKLQLIDNNPKNANEKDARYQELMNILQSLWLCDPPENEHVFKKGDHHSVDDEFIHTSSSGVDVNSGSTGSGNSSDGVNGNVSHAHTSAETLRKIPEVCEGEADAEAEAKLTSEREVEAMYEEKQKEDDPDPDDTITGNDSPRELPTTPPSSNKSSNKSSENDNKIISQDPDPVWVLNLLTKIEKQFMTHYINAMREFKVRWKLDNNEQLDMMIGELKTEIHKRIQTSINRELRHIQCKAGPPRPPKEAMSRASTTQTEERRQRLKIMLKQSIDHQAEKSDYSATETSYSDQRSENDDEFCPCETCIQKKITYRPPLPAEVMNTAPVVMDFDLKRILLMKNSGPCNTQTDESIAEDACTAELMNAEEDDVTVTAEELSKEPAEEAETEDEIDVEREIAVYELKEETAEATTAQDENAGEEDDVAATTEDESDKDDAVEEGTVDEEEIAATSADESADENDATADESSKEPAEVPTTEDEMAVEEETAVTDKDESKDEIAEEEIETEEAAVLATTENESDKEEAVDAGTVDD